MEKEDSKIESTLRLVRSQQFTPEMAINYLYHWRQKEGLLQILLARINQFFKAGNDHLVPTAMYFSADASFIMSLERNQILERFCETLSKESLSCYLLLRWSYSTYLEDKEAAKNRLDNSIFTKNNLVALGDDMELLNRLMKEKEIKLNYTISLNDYYDRLFHIPEKLKKIAKEQRNDNLRERLMKLHSKFYSKNPHQKAVLLPVQHKSSMAVGVSYQHCITFSTKERVPFKIVYETVSQEDLATFTKGEIQPVEPQKEEKESLILPQSYFGPEWTHERDKIAEGSPYRFCSSYRIRSFIIKSGDDLRQEHMAMQLISMVKQICKKQNIKIWLKTYAVIPFDQESGLIQFVQDTRTVSYLKERSKCSSLRDVYKQLFGDNWETSVSNFVESLAGYSVVQYLFQIKDRHNNNILIDNCGHIIHIDFSFIISSSPGNFGFEKAPFKLTKDYVQLMDGIDSDIFLHFKHLFFFALKFIRNYKRDIMEMVEMMTHCKNMKCFQKFDREALASRFHEGTTDQELMDRVEGIVKAAVNSYTTGHYDVYQWFTNYIYS